jgi:hypothetical protein
MHSIWVLHRIQGSEAQAWLPNHAVAAGNARHALRAAQAGVLLQHMPDVQALGVEQP